MTAICAVGGQAPAAPHHGFATFNYDQANHPAFALIGPAPLGAPNGLCLSLTMAWLKNWKDHRNPYNQFVGPGGGGNLNVLNYMVAIFAGMGGPAGWPGQTSHFMTLAVGAGGLGFAPVGGGMAAGPAWPGIVNGLQHLLAAARYSILVATIVGGGTHAVGIFRSGQAIYFFDCNEGEVYFRNSDDFIDWFRVYKNPGFGYAGFAGPNLWNFKYN